MTTKSGLQRRQQRPTLFAQGRHIAANARKGLSTSQAAEAAGDFLLHFDHAQISLGEIIGSSRQLHRLHLWRKE
jgi:hypothetical protein